MSVRPRFIQIEGSAERRAFPEATGGAATRTGPCFADSLIKLYGSDPEGEKRYSPEKCIGTIQKPITGDPDPKHISTSYIERQNLTMRMSMRRFTRLTNAFSKKVQNHVCHVALYTVFYNFCRIHKTLKVSPAMASGVSDTLRDAEWIVGLIDARAPKPAKPGPKGLRRKSH